MSACDSALLLVDATQGIQAQTLANYYLAMEQNLTIIPLITKIDLPSALPDVVALEMENTLGMPKDDILRTSAKSGKNCELILPALLKKGPP